jgi:histidine triad (HIT) family protein|tara:strand:- start:29718 stop:30113 length:396 start_codon:yes stop_codon:yes gene_type:complete
MESIFSKIVKGELPAYKVAEDEKFIAFLDISPITKGHVLVVPKKETDYIFDIETIEYIDFWIFSRFVAKAIERVIECERIGIAVIGLEVPHAHIHLVPLNKGVTNIDFNKTKIKLTHQEFEEIAQRIRKEI